MEQTQICSNERVLLKMGRLREHSLHAAFLFSRKIQYPPSAHNMKASYISQELLRRGVKITWVHVGKERIPPKRDSIDFLTISSSSFKFSFMVMLFKFAIYCVQGRVSFVYVDEWHLFHGHPLRILFLQLLLKTVRVKFVFDQRDPLLDFWVAIREIDNKTRRYRRLRSIYLMIYRLADLIILPSKDYQDDIIAQGIPRSKVLGIFRGIDVNTFNSSADREPVRKSLAIEGKFVIGWFGIMHRFRLIKEVIIPIIEQVETIPNAHVLIGGDGPLRDEFISLKQRKPQLPFTLIDFIPYQDLPSHIAACDILLCPVETRYRLTRLALWLKVIESLAAGRPVLATRAQASLNAYGDLAGIIWVDEKRESFLKVLKNFTRDFSSYPQAAARQAENLGDYSISSSMPKVADRILHIVRNE